MNEFHGPDGIIPLDGNQPDDIAPAEIESDFPAWRIWIGADQMMHGLRITGAVITARGETWQDLRDEIRLAELRLEQA